MPGSQRILLVLPSWTYRTQAFMRAAGELDADLIVASDHKQAMSDLVPDRSLTLNFRKPAHIAERVRDLHERQPIDAVVGVDDLSAWVAAVAGQAIGLPVHQSEAVAVTRNKLRMREAFAAAGLPTPAFRAVPLHRPAPLSKRRIDYPCVVKPLFLSASRGVTRANDRAGLSAAMREIARLYSETDVRARALPGETDLALVEDYIPGIEVAVEGMLLDGELKALAIFDKPDPLEGPHFVETIYVTPSRLPAYVQREILHMTHRAAHAIGLRRGPVHAELRVNADGVWPVEVAARSIGGLCSRVLRFRERPEDPEATLSLESLILRQALGRDIAAIQRERPAAAVMMLPIPREGRLLRVAGVEAARAVPGIEDLVITIPEETAVVPMPWGGRYLGFLFARADLPEEAEAAIRRAYGELSVVYGDA